ncbi:site-specific integrase [Polynucleobacter sp. AP-Nino-20-G2]|uniref:tyrosine-type recombinase/integrase n=1 Tax=Polynucleobacter sp. AP-Nino-20-G2 TaxID=2576917 RepID=UPI001BFE7F2A|nr:site-specific integrase [Polynucleobacter sp. AP-Nino-20-G2]QWE17540.1 site-specific integrase [Polynucleobacter sp. AP-Nino-20-G2]
MEHQKIAVNAPLVRGEQFTLSALADAYMASFTGRDPYQHQRLHFFVEKIGHLYACEIDADHVDDCLDALKARGKLMNKGGTRRGGEIIATHKPLSNSTLNRYRSTLQATLTWARKKRLMPKGWSNPVNDTQRLPEDNARTRYLKPDEYERLIQMCRISHWNKLTALVMMAVTTGARRGALMGLKWEDVDLEKGEAFVSRTKNGEPFVLVLIPEVVAELKRFESKVRKDELVFGGLNPYKPANFNKVWNTALQDANVANTNVVFHTLRHTHASWLAKQGAPLLAIADSMGHKSLAMTKRYSHLCIDSRKEIIQKTFQRM